MKAGGHRLPPGPKGDWFTGSSKGVRENPLELYTEATKRYGDVVRFRATPGLYWYLVTGPNDVEHILQKNQTNYRKPDIFLKPVRMLVGNGLLSSEGDEWLQQRRLAQPAFHRHRLADFAGTITNSTIELFPILDRAATEGDTVDLSSFFTKLTMKIVTLTLFSMDVSEDSDKLGMAIRDAFEFVSHQMRYGLLITPPFLPTERNRRFANSKKLIDEAVFEIINERRRSGKDEGDLLSMLLQARDEETGKAMSDRELRDQITTILLAGHDTMAATMSWCWYLLARNREQEDTLHQELSSVLGGRPPTFNDLPSLPYTRMILEETLRLFPPAWGIIRESIEADEVGGYHLPPKTLVSLCQWVTHRSARYWEMPADFDPHRFLPKRSANRHKMAYFPFGGGARQCIGNNLAMLEGELIIATIAQEYSFDLVANQEIVPDPTFTLRPKYGIKVKVRKLT
jgi:cytochrome P450